MDGIAVHPNFLWYSAVIGVYGAAVAAFGIEGTAVAAARAVSAAVAYAGVDHALVLLLDLTGSGTAVFDVEVMLHFQ